MPVEQSISHDISILSDIPSYLKECKNLIGSNNTGKSIQQLKKLYEIRSDIALNDLVILESQYTSANGNKRTGEISDDQYNKEIAKINRGLLGLIDEVGV